MKEEIKAGDRVMLKSGGPEMTVKEIKGDEAECTWFNDGKLSQESFSIASLIKCRKRGGPRVSTIGD